jgi:DNA-binding CsgD family transcriptional regulator/tetratricopeptide (TPR) repeat protein
MRLPTFRGAHDVASDEGRGMTAALSDHPAVVSPRAVLPAWSAGGQALQGRDEERRAVADLLRRAQRGLGGVLLVEGEDGIGKSRLLGESVHVAAGQGFSLAAGAADPLGRTIPCSALRAALREPLGQPAPGDHAEELPDTPAGWIGRLRAHLEQRAATAPVLVSLDDLQWGSPAMLAVLRSLPRELKQHPVAWLFARSSARPGDAGLLFSALERDGATRFELAPLDDDAVAGLLTDAFGAPPASDLLALGSGAAGNPTLLTELIGGLRDDGAVMVTGGHAALISRDLPQRIVDAAQQRLEGLSGRARHLLATAAVLGRSFRLEDAADMLGETPAALLPAVEEAMGAGIMLAAEDAFTFRHELVGRAVAEMVPRPARKALHRQYGELLLSRGEPAALAAGHLLQAAHPRDPASLAGLDRAAAQTLASSPQTAADLAAQALELTPPGDPGAVPRLVTAAEALAAAGRAEHAASLARDALARPLPALQEARLRCVLSSVLCASGRAQDASAAAGLVLAQSQLPADLRDRAVTAQLQALARLPADPAAGRLADTVFASAHEYGDQAIAAARITRALISWDNGQISQALESLRDAARRGSGVSPDARDPQPLLALAAALVDLRQLDQAKGILRAVGQDKLRGIAPEAVAPILRARMHLATARLADAAAEAESALARAETLSAHCCAWEAHSVLAMIELRRGDLAAAAQHVAAGPAPVPRPAGVYARADTALAQARVTEARNGPAAALSLVRDICAGLPAHRGLLAADPAAAAWLIRVSLAAGEKELAAGVAGAARALAYDNPGFATLAVAAAHALGLARRDPARLARAAAQHEDPWARASAAEDLGVLLASKEDEDQAVRRLSDALDGYARAGAVIDKARVRRRLRKLGVRRRHWTSPAGRPASGWASLTDTECTASRLVAQGLNNQQIADRMYISIHTVACHLRQTYRKLNIGSRVELARIVIERHAAEPALAAGMAPT